MTWKGEYTHQRDLHYRGRCWGQAPLCAWIYQWHVQPKHTSCCGWELFFVPTAKSKIKIYLHITLSIQVLGWLWEVIRGFVRPALCDTHQYFWKKRDNCTSVVLTSWILPLRSCTASWVHRGVSKYTVFWRSGSSRMSRFNAPIWKVQH